MKLSIIIPVFNEESFIKEILIRINNVNQYHPVHYHEKDFPTEEMYEYFRSMAGVC